MQAVWQDHFAARRVPWSARAGSCPSDWHGSLVLRLVQRGWFFMSGVDIENSCALCRGTARCGRIHPMPLRVERDSGRIGLHSHAVLQFSVAWHGRVHYQKNLEAISARSAIGLRHISHHRSVSPRPYEARLDWGLIRTSNVGLYVPSARVLSMVDVANFMPTFGIRGPQDGISIQ